MVYRLAAKIVQQRQTMAGKAAQRRPAFEQPTAAPQEPSGATRGRIACRTHITHLLRTIMRKVLMLSAALFFGLTSMAAGASEATVKAALEKKYPQIQIETVTKTPLAGIYEVYASGQLLYTDEKVDYLFVNGSMIDIEKKTNLTE